MHFGTSLWDTCAPEAVLRAAGGRCTDLFGAPLVHDPERPGGGLINDLGVLATGRDLAARDVRVPGRDHDALAAAMRGDDELRAALLTKYAGEANRVPDDAPPLRGAGISAHQRARRRRVSRPARSPRSTG